MKTSTFKSICESAKRVMLGEAEAPVAPEAEAPVAPEAEAPVAPEADAAPEVPAPDEEAPATTGSAKPKYVVQCNKDGQEAVLLLSKKDLEDFVHENGAKCVVKLYELGKEAKVPTVKVKV
jgi:3-oxoacyl-ACP reductase-like protein